MIDTRSMAEEQLHGNTMCFEMIEGLVVVVHIDAPPDRAEWSTWVDFAGRTHQSRGGLRVIVFAAGIADGPNSSQRAEYSHRVPAERTKVAIIADGLAARAAVTAFAWFNPNIRGFRSDALNEAFAYLAAEPTAALDAAVERMREHMSAAGRPKLRSR